MFFEGKTLRSFLGITSRYEAIKIIVMAACFFIVIAAYTVVRELKDSVFVLTVGQCYLPDVKALSFLVMVPLVLFYSWLASRVTSYRLIMIYATLYGLGGLLGAYFLNHPTIGLDNDVASPARVFGWVYYLFFEGYSPFVVSVLWALFNSISKPEEIRNRYVLMTVATKSGGVFSAGLAWLFMSRYFIAGHVLSETAAHVYVLAFFSLLLLCVPFLIGYLTYAVPCEYLQGYTHKDQSCAAEKTASERGSGSGFSLLLKYPYVLGIFGMIFFWEAVNVIFGYMRLGIGLKEADSMMEFSAFLLKGAMLTQLTGLAIALFGTSSLINLLGERFALMVIPVITGGAILTCLCFQTTTAVIVTYVFIRALNYSFAYPLREGLYIPTSGAVKFKAKSWIDGLGSRVSKGFGSLYNKFIQLVPLHFLQSFQLGFFMGVIVLWTCLAYAMGRRWFNAVKKNEIIGGSSPAPEESAAA